MGALCELSLGCISRSSVAQSLLVDYFGVYDRFLIENADWVNILRDLQTTS